MTYELFIEQSVQMIELNLNIIIYKNRHLINALDKGDNHPLIRKYSRIPFS